MIVPVILAGGLGTRLWPLSRPDSPKPLIRLDGTKSMIQQTVLRARSIPDSQRPVIVCGEAHYRAINRHMDEIGHNGYTALLEPAGRGTAPAAAAAALVSDREDLLLVMPADHVIEDLDAFLCVIGLATNAAKVGSLVTFGIAPDRPETGYGYIERGRPIDGMPGCYRITSFREKPDRSTALEYVTSGRHWWNSGMFLFSAGAFLDELGTFDPEMLFRTESAVQTSKSLRVGSSNMIGRLLNPESFLPAPHGSIDRTVMERTQRGAVAALRAGWSDVGSWAALWDTGGKDQRGNVVSGSVQLRDVSSSYVRADGRPVVVIGLDRVIVIDAGDALLVAGMDHAQAVKEIGKAPPA